MPVKGGLLAASEAGRKLGNSKRKLGSLAKARQNDEGNKLDQSKVNELVDNVGDNICVMHTLVSETANMTEAWTKTNRFNGAVGAVICFNAIVLGLEADFAQTYPFPFMVLEHIFSGIFTLELLLHIVVEGAQSYLSDRMNWLDAFLVLSAVTDVWIIQPLGVDADLKLMSLFRMLRLIRLIRLLRLFRMFKELSIMVEGLVDSIPTILWTLMFLSVLLYIGAIFARTTIGLSFKCEDGKKCSHVSPGAEPTYSFNPDIGDQMSLFGGVDRTMVTLFCCLVEGCGVDIITPVTLKTPVLFLYFFLFTGFTTFGVLNLIVAIFCENCVQHGEDNTRWMQAHVGEQKKQLILTLQRTYEAMDRDGDGKLTKEELLEGVSQNELVMDAFIELGLEEEEDLFQTLDADHSGFISFNQFCEGILLMLKGQNPALAKDMVAPTLLLQAFSKRCHRLEKELADMIATEEIMRKKIKTIRNLSKVATTDLATCFKRIQVVMQEVALLKDIILKPPPGRIFQCHSQGFSVSSSLTFNVSDLDASYSKLSSTSLSL